MTCKFCDLQILMQRIMVDIEAAPKVGVFYDVYVSTVFNTADEAFHVLSHECTEKAQ